MRKLVLWGYGVDDLKDMFGLSRKDLDGRILEYGCGPDAVNAVLTAQGKNVVSCDPLFALDKNKLASEVQIIFSEMVDAITKEVAHFDFGRKGSLDNLIKAREKGLATFFNDYDEGKKQGRYLGEAGMPLPFADFSFDFALCSHYLFAQLDRQTIDFHIEVIQELARVAKEVRIFPLIDRKGITSEMLGPVLLALQKAHFGVEVREVGYHLHPTGNAMLRVWALQCAV